ncbi:MAG TPA: nucleoside-diphosphate kinase [Bacteroidia bacterium]|nr:nucleoside-diphosphate kinase [Bacteroidia bacterium]HRS59401.1 nucleoside-diphosphate kinase [Bacteroidia bacterium]HRU68485.1 nucleoside-diphosphate kinase [Bacteroidia bacterium]
MGSITFTIIKPEILRKEQEGEVLDAIIKGGFQVIALKKTRFTPQQAEKFYAIHKGKPFFEGLVSYITSGPVYVAILKKENAVQAYREFIGATDPSKAAEGTIRHKFGTNIEQNAVHGSDSDENAVIESNFFFSETERFE